MGQIKGLILKAADRPELERWARARNLPYRQVQRARMLLALAEGQAVAVVATAVGVVEATVARWRDRYLAGGPVGVARPAAARLSPDLPGGGPGSHVAEIAGATAGRPYALEPEPDGAGHRPCAVSAATVVVGHPDPTPSHAYFQAVAGPRV